MTDISLFDVIGPNMVGPSSSHTAGAVSIALLAEKIFKGTGKNEEHKREIEKVTFTLYGSFARTYKGHGTDKALLGGILGFETFDLRIRDAFIHAKEAGIQYEYILSEEEPDHPNTVDIQLQGTDNGTLSVRGVSLGGGKVKITRLNGIVVDFTGEYDTLIVSHRDRAGIAAHITKCLSEFYINIAFMRVFREEKGAAAYTVVESDEEIYREVVRQVWENEYITDVILL